ncbi:class I SAM-dependent methyltransferase [Algoriphagus namhaensis]|uniref:Class I SAM-dependent methyltransferase n=1 Tax=Algoriphagus namhaensis TaxID=915353 RepID=A0ABV8ASJ1_9BACT
MQTEDPYWLKEAYEKSINNSDTGYMFRNNLFAKKLTILLYLQFGDSGKFLDYAGGYGVFVRLMRDIGFDFYWADKYTDNLFAQGFEYDSSQKYDAVTSFEVFEHFEDPVQEIRNLFDLSDTIIFSTELHPNPLPKPEDWWYYGVEHGQHIALYSKKTLQHIAQMVKCRFYSVAGLHILSKTPISLKHLKSTKYSRFGYHKWIGKKLHSKTWSDHQFMVSKANDGITKDILEAVSKHKN